MAKATNTKIKPTTAPTGAEKVTTKKTPPATPAAPKGDETDKGDATKMPGAATPNDSAAKTKNPKKELDAKMKPYVEAYPANKTFYITTDGNVFLEANKQDAYAHEKTLGKDGEVDTYTN